MPFLTEPLARGLDLASEEAAVVQRKILRSKRPLRYMYEAVYRKMLGAEAQYLTPSGGLRLELGSGGGFLSEMDGSILTSDVKHIDGIDHVVDAQHLPFADGSIDALHGMHVLHHVPDVRRFFAELDRCLTPGGGFVAVEPYWSPLARLLYQHFHPEPFDLAATRWEFEAKDPMSSNQALSHILLVRDRAVFDAEYPGLEILMLEPFGGPSYILTGGIWKRSALPGALLMRLWEFEERHTGWRRALALHHLFVIRRRDPAGWAHPRRTSHPPAAVA